MCSRIITHDDTVEVYERTAERYRRKTVRGTIPEFQQVIRMIPKGGTVLDVGCAWGREVKKFSDYGFSVTGIDPTMAFVYMAKKYVPKAKIIKTDIQHMNFPRSSFNLIWATAVLLHLPRRSLIPALRKFHRLLKPNGILQIRMKEGKGEDRVTDPLVGKHRRLFTYVTKSELTKMVKITGFTILNKKTYPDIYGRKDVLWVGVIAKK